MSSTSDSELSTDYYITSSDECTEGSTGRCSSGEARDVPPLDLSKLNYNNKKKGAKAPLVSPILTKSQYAIHPPTPGFKSTCQGKVSQVDAKMLEFERSEIDQLSSVLQAVNVEMLANDDEIVENNEVLYRQSMDCEHLWYDNRVSRLNKQQLRKDIDQSNWYIEKSKEELRGLKVEHTEKMKEDKKLKKSNRKLMAEIKSLESDISELNKIKGLSSHMPVEQLKDRTKQARQEGLKIASENEIRSQSLAQIKKHLSKCRNKSSSSVSVKSKDPERIGLTSIKRSKLPPINSKQCRNLEQEDDGKFSVGETNSFTQGNVTCTRLPNLEQKIDKNKKHMNKSSDATEGVKLQNVERYNEPINRTQDLLKAQNKRNGRPDDTVLPPIEYQKQDLRDTTRIIGNSRGLDRMVNKKDEKSTGRKKSRTKLPPLMM